MKKYLKIAGIVYIIITFFYIGYCIGERAAQERAVMAGTARWDEDGTLIYLKNY